MRVRQNANVSGRGGKAIIFKSGLKTPVLHVKQLTASVLVTPLDATPLDATPLDATPLDKTPLRAPPKRKCVSSRVWIVPSLLESVTLQSKEVDLQSKEVEVLLEDVSAWLDEV